MGNEKSSPLPGSDETAKADEKHLKNQNNADDSTMNKLSEWMKPFGANVTAGIVASLLVGPIVSVFNQATAYMKNLQGNIWTLIIILGAITITLLGLSIYLTVRVLKLKPKDRKFSDIILTMFTWTLFAVSSAVIVVVVPYFVAINSNMR